MRLARQGLLILCGNERMPTLYGDLSETYIGFIIKGRPN